MAKVIRDGVLHLVPASELVPGDRIVLYTDGIVESRSFLGGDYGLERLEAVVRADPALHPARVADALVADLGAFTMGAPIHDDRAFLCAGYLGRTADPKLGPPPGAQPGDSAASPPPDRPAEDPRAAFSRVARESSGLDPAAALVAWRLHIAGFPEDHRAINNEGVLLHRLGKDAEAAAAFRRALILAPGDRRILRNLALVTGDRSDI